MKKISLCSKMSRIVSDFIYVASLPFLILSFLYGAIPHFNIPHQILSILFFIIVGLAVLKSIMAIIIDYKLCNWGNTNKNKISLRQHINLL